MDDSRVFFEILALLKGLVLWANSLPTWGMVAFTFVASSLISKLGIAAEFALVILFWNVFGAVGAH